jgi:cyclopropane-fatty-acyl-phospholipid synthase
MTLEEAQRAKNRHVFEKLGLGPADHVLEIGCGWGGFAIQAATEVGCRVTGLTLSPSQAGFARARVDALGLDDRLEIREEDYRLIEGRFSKVASIEMLEAIGLAEYGNYFAAIDRLLVPEGLACLQTIGVPDWRFERYRRRPDWIQQTIFPGSLLPSLEAIAKAVARTQLQINGVEEIGFGYARTLREWRQNVAENVGRIRALGYDERFLRIWAFYLCYCEAGFAIRSLRNMQIVLSHSGNDALPAFPSVRQGY